MMTFTTATTAEVLLAIGARLRAQRLHNELSQQELALMAGLSLGAIRKLERDGQVSLETLVRATQALGVVAELDPVFLARRESIAEMAAAASARGRQRAPRRSLA
jgi:transcriptional regulator with XRE-family HTH domain